MLLGGCHKCTTDLKNAMGASSFYCCGGLDVTYSGRKSHLELLILKNDARYLVLCPVLGVAFMARSPEGE